MKYRELTQEQYDERLRLVIVGSEGLHTHAQDVGDGKATIGWGYTFNRNDNARIWTDSGIALDERQWSQLSAIDAAPASQKTRLGLAFERELTPAESDRLLRASMADYERPADQLGMPLSDERVALTSVAYNRGPHKLLGSDTRPEHPVMGAIREGDRAEAWYQIRYNCWGSNADVEGGLRKRRFAEAHVFGLYDDPSNVGVEEARTVTAMHERHRNEIDSVELRFGDSLNAAPAKPNRIAQANRDYPTLVGLYGEVPTLESALAPAAEALSRSAGLVSPGQPPPAADRRNEDAPGLPTSGPAPMSPHGTEGDARPLLQQSREAVRRLDGVLGRTYDEASERMAANLALLARTSGLDRIDHAVLSLPTALLKNAEHVFVVQGGVTDPTNRVAYMKTQDALSMPPEQSLQSLAQRESQQLRHREVAEPEVQARQPAHRMTV